MFPQIQEFLRRNRIIYIRRQDKKTHWRPGVLIKTIHASIGLVALAAIVTLGPIDTLRVGYNASIGDITPLKRELLQYVTKNIQQEQPLLTPAELERALSAIELRSNPRSTFPMMRGMRFRA